MHREEDRRQAEEDRQERQARSRDVDGGDVDQRLPEVGEDPAAEPNAADDRGEAVVEEHEVGRLACDVGAALAHGDADMGGLQRRGVVDPVAGHGDDFAVGLERLDQRELLLRPDAGEDPHAA